MTILSHDPHPHQEVLNHSIQALVAVFPVEAILTTLLAQKDSFGYVNEDIVKWLELGFKTNFERE